MLIYLAILCLSNLGIAVSYNDAVSTWPNAFPKQLAAVRRRQGLTTSEFLYHHTFVHGQKSWNAPDTFDQPLAYVQGHIFDSAYGINTTKNHAHVPYFGHSDMTELYSRSKESFATPPANNYTATVIGPDANAFSDFSASVSMYGFETFEEVNNDCLLTGSSETYNAFYWLYANASNAGTSSFDNVTFARNVMEIVLQLLPRGSIYNASTHTPVPGLDSRAYYGGYNNPALNAVVKLWLCDDNHAITAFRDVQLALIAMNKSLGVDFDKSFVMFTRAVLIYDRTRNTPFDANIATQVLLADRFRSNVAGPPLKEELQQ
ncbi:hypothetical protein OPT61_g1071 [Boeremia exigua]|uniref:Uncharacterized protein n=1 Tax=Boeremia exigua TaxID=749465 RepID=A0ACC2IRP0_9PLEO|nr:hypothetical protein OPT61_g1071 [Boeremia exigua]